MHTHLAVDDNWSHFNNVTCWNGRKSALVEVAPDIFTQFPFHQDLALSLIGAPCHPVGVRPIGFWPHAPVDHGAILAPKERGCGGEESELPRCSWAMIRFGY